MTECMRLCLKEKVIAETDDFFAPMRHPSHKRKGKREVRQELGQRVYRFKAFPTYRKNLWRVIEIRGDQTFGDLDDMMQDAFNHDLGDHLSEFYLGSDRDWQSRGLGVIKPFGGGKGRDIVLGEIGLEVGDELRYVYDFGDYIQHTLILEAIEEAQLDVEYPRIITQNKPRYRYCKSCSEKGKKVIATWICVWCSDKEQRDVLLCEECLSEEHEDHYSKEWLY